MWCPLARPPARRRLSQRINPQKLLTPVIIPATIARASPMQLVEPRPNRPLPIRITPLIDVVFILLVFFMLTTRLLPVDYLELGNNTESRSSVTGEPLPELQVTASGQVLWQDTRYHLADLLEALQNAGIREANRGTSADTRLADFTRTLSALDNAGVEAHWNRQSTNDL